MIAAIVDTGPLLKVLYSSLLAGVSVAIVFSVAVLGVTRSNELRRIHRTGAATAYAVLAIVGVALSLAIVVYGVVLVAHKS
jgi:Na+/H+-dicarboxylate symporter